MYSEAGAVGKAIENKIVEKIQKKGKINKKWLINWFNIWKMPRRL
jgi:hypothetical protein